MLGAVDLRRLAEDRGAALLDQQIGGAAERRVGGDAGIAVRAAALERQHDLRDRHALAPRRRWRVGSISLIMATPRSTVFRVPPVAWMVMVRNISFSFRP